MGIALGHVGMSLDDFCRCTPVEFEHIYKAYSEQAEAEFRDRWERMRLLATIVIQPHVKKKLTAKKLLHLPWDDAVKKEANTPQVSKEEALDRFKQLIKKS